MPRYKLTIEYDGRDFVGWQRQANGFSVQEAVETAIQRFSSEQVTVFGAGRTDAGVHALAQVVHVDLATPTDAHTVMRAINFHLKPHPVVVLASEAAPDDFHARFSATARCYLYRIVNRPAPLTIDRGRAWHVAGRLNAKAMQRAAQGLLGHHDFTTFRAKTCQADSPVKTLDALAVARHGPEIRVRAVARSFLHHQVRNMVGTLKLVGEGKRSEADVQVALAARDRAAGGPTAPACGLYLAEVRYGVDAPPPNIL